MKVYVVEGNIGSGKSTFLNELLKKEPHLTIIQEPVEQWYTIQDDEGVSVFTHFYNDPHKYSFMFQINVLASRMRAINEARKNNPDGILVFERSIMTDQSIFVPTLRQNGTLSSIESQVFDTMYETIVPMLDFKTDGIIYLRCDPKTSHERMRARNRAGEECVPIEYLTALHDRHEAWLMHESAIPVLVVDNNSDLVVDDACTFLTR